jgi:hypothetical protein
MNATQARLYRTAIKNGKRHGVGGTSWTGKRLSSANNITALATTTDIAAQTMYFLREQLVRFGQPSAPIQIGVDGWRFVAPSSATIRVGDVYTSVADSSMSFVIGSLETDQGYPTGEASPKQ